MKNLSSRQLQIGRALLKGKRNKEIAQEIGVKERTVKAHITQMLLRMNIQPDKAKLPRIQLAVELYKRHPELL